MPANFAVILAAGVLLVPGAASAQVANAPRDTSEIRADAGDVVGTAMAAQARFERRRSRLFPLSFGAAGGGRCDEHVGRFCEWYHEGEWYPTPEDPEITTLREDFLAQLDDLQEMAPASDWILGQRVWYRAQAGAWEASAATARECGGAERWWCAALEGFALHGAGRYEAAAKVFGVALEEMEPEQRKRWSSPRWPIDGDARDLLDDARGRLDEDTSALESELARLWTLADPLYLVPGNDRKTAHYARWTVAHISERARNPFHIPWGDDLTQLTVRHGWAMGWERSVSRVLTSPDDVISHNHPEGRDFMPAGEVLEAPAQAHRDQMRAERQRPRSLYAPDYAPVLLPMDGQIAVFPRVGESIVVASHHLPEDTTYHADHAHERMWMEPGVQADVPDRIGLYVVDFGRGASLGEADGAPSGAPLVRGVSRVGSAEGALALRVGPGEYVVSAESWSPASRRAGRTRQGVVVRGAVEDVATLSDLLLLESGADPGSLEDAVARALPRLTLARDQRFVVAWEVAGLGFRPETLEFEISVEKTGRSVFRRVGEFLRLSDRPRPLGLSWQEPASERPGSSFHAIDLDLPPLDPGTYEIRLVLRTADRSPAERTLEFVVSEERGSTTGGGAPIGIEPR